MWFYRFLDRNLVQILQRFFIEIDSKFFFKDIFYAEILFRDNIERFYVVLQRFFREILFRDGFQRFFIVYRDYILRFYIDILQKFYRDFTFIFRDFEQLFIDKFFLVNMKLFSKQQYKSVYQLCVWRFFRDLDVVSVILNGLFCLGKCL